MIGFLCVEANGDNVVAHVTQNLVLGVKIAEGIFHADAWMEGCDKSVAVRILVEDVGEGNIASSAEVQVAQQGEAEICLAVIVLGWIHFMTVCVAV